MAAPTRRAGGQGNTTTTSNTAVTVPKPTTVSVGDFLWIELGFNSPIPIPGNPVDGSGDAWNVIGPTASTIGAGYFFWKIADGTETNANWTVTLDAAARWSIFTGAISGINTASPIAASDVANNAANVTAHVAPTVTPAMVDTLVLYLYFGTYTNLVAYSYSGYTRGTEFGDVATASRMSMAAAEETRAASGATGTNTATCSGSIRYATMTVAIAPIPVSAVMAAPLGALTGVATATVTTPSISATMNAPLGALVGSATAVVDHPATLAAPLGELVGAATATPEHLAVLTASLGGLVGAATAVAGLAATLTAPLGGLLGSVTATVEHPAVLASPLGELAGSATALVSHDAVLAAPLGELVGLAFAGATVDAVLTASLGALVGSATATVYTPIEVQAVMDAPLGALVGVITGDVIDVVYTYRLIGPIVGVGWQDTITVTSPQTFRQRRAARMAGPTATPMTIYKIDGVWKAGSQLRSSVLAAAEVVYQGGHEFTVLEGDYFEMVADGVVPQIVEVLA